MKPRRVPELDLLRFIAAVSVLIYHDTYRPAVNGTPSETLFGSMQLVSRFGYLGVTLFFLISGFVILWTAQGRTPAQFATSRFLRLYPSFWVAMLVTTAFLFWLAPSSSWPDAKTVLLNLTMLPGYAHVDFIDGVYWTLAVEMKFYFLVLILIVARQMKHIEKWLGLWLIGLTACELSTGHAWIESITIYPFGSLFVGGCILYLVHAEGWTVWRVAGLLWAVVLSCLDAVPQAKDFIHGVTGSGVLIAVALVLVCFTAVTAVAIRSFKIGFSGLAIALGGLTYPLYLVHNRVGKLIFAATEEYMSAYWRLLLIVATSVAIAVLIVELVEKRGVSRLARTPPIRRLMGQTQVRPVVGEA